MANTEEEQQFEEPEEENRPYPGGHKAYNLYTGKWCYN